MNEMPFANYEGFKELFGMRVTADGKERKNKILLAYLKCGPLRSYIRNTARVDAEQLLRVSSMGDLFDALNKVIADTSFNENRYTIRIMGLAYASNDYWTDGQNGICVDGDTRGYRYVRADNERIFKMRIGKMYKHIILGCSFGRLLPEPVVLYMCEEITRRWETYVSTMTPQDTYELHVDDDFYAIYDGTGRCLGNFESCMSGGEHSSFYHDSVKAKAAYLTNEDGRIVARCVIYQEVIDNATGEVFRLAERQYSTDGDELLKRILVQKLIDGGYIDGYKRPGAGCHDAKAFVTNSGESMSDRLLKIECWIDTGDTLSYQDSFKWLNVSNGYAYNGSNCDYDYALDSTDLNLEGDDDDDGLWSDYNNEYISSDDAVWVETRDDYFYPSQTVYAYVADGRGGYEQETCYRNDVLTINGDFFYAGKDAEDPAGEGIHECPHCGEYFIPGYTEHFYGECTDEDYCSRECRDAAENEWKEDNGWTYAEVDGQFFENEDDVTTIRVRPLDSGGWDERTISIERVEKGVADGRYVEHDGHYYTFFAYHKVAE